MKEATEAEMQQRNLEQMNRARAMPETPLPPIRWRRARLTFEIHVPADGCALDLDAERCRRAAEAVARALDLGPVVCVTPVGLVLTRDAPAAEGEADAPGAD